MMASEWFPITQPFPDADGFTQLSKGHGCYDAVNGWILGQSFLDDTSWFGKYTPVPGGPGSWEQLTGYGRWRNFGGSCELSGKLYWFCGEDGADGVAAGADTFTTKIYTIATATWSDGASLPVVGPDTGTKRYYPAATALNGSIYLAGGFGTGTNSDLNNRLDRYDPATDTWTSLTHLPQVGGTGMDFPGIAANPDTNKLYVAQYDEINIYDVGLNSWRTIFMPYDENNKKTFISWPAAVFIPETSEVWIMSGGGSGSDPDLVVKFNTLDETFDFAPRSIDDVNGDPWHIPGGLLLDGTQVVATYILNIAMGYDRAGGDGWGVILS